MTKKTKQAKQAKPTIKKTMKLSALHKKLTSLVGHRYFSAGAVIEIICDIDRSIDRQGYENRNQRRSVYAKVERDRSDGQDPIIRFIVADHKSAARNVITETAFFTLDEIDSDTWRVSVIEDFADFGTLRTYDFIKKIESENRRDNTKSPYGTK